MKWINSILNMFRKETYSKIERLSIYKSMLIHYKEKWRLRVKMSRHMNFTEYISNFYPQSTDRIRFDFPELWVSGEIIDKSFDVNDKTLEFRIHFLVNVIKSMEN